MSNNRVGSEIRWLTPKNREVFLRELLSNANDALEKLRILSLKDKKVWDGSEPLNITIKAVKDEDGKGGRVVIAGKLMRITRSCNLHINA